MTELETQATGVTIDEQIGQALKRMPVTDAKIKALGAEYLPLKTKGVDDKESYNAVYLALSTVIKVRTSIEASRKILKADALKFGRAVDAEADRLTSMVSPIEEHLYQQRMVVDNEVARIKAVKEAEEQEKYQGRAFKLAKLGMSFDGNIYKRRDIVIVALNLKRLSDADFEIVLKSVQDDYESDQAKIAEEARIKKEEDDRSAAEKLAQDKLREEENKRLVVEKERLEAIAKEQAEREAAIQTTQRVIEEEKRVIEAGKRVVEDQKRKEEEAKKHQEEIEKVRQEAAEQARKDEQLRVEREAIEAEEKKAQMTDKEKLKDLLAIIQNITFPQFKSKKAQKIAVEVEKCFISAAALIEAGL